MRALFLILALLLPGAAASAQETRPILTLHSDRLFEQSQFGQRIQEEIDGAYQELSAENRRIEAELEAEERDLTQRRSQMTPEAFRPLAEAFDAKVVEIRREQEAKSRDIASRSEEGFQAFMQVAVPVLGTLMSEHGAEVILEARSVFIAAQRVDITAEAVARIDEAIGDGTDLAPDGDDPPLAVPPAAGGTEGGPVVLTPPNGMQPPTPEAPQD
ncbi:OmpH family outer membrane protein [Halodurantibacterium flavum]|uniref:OmpH family outer membrane protein n=1 Tax=Halodurantibacterium flavum TaxID=1382802 RepID=A0ABW4SBS7_9RHOB